MSSQFKPEENVDAILAADDADSAFDEWTLDDLDGSADLAPLRSAWTRNDNSYD